MPPPPPPPRGAASARRLEEPKTGGGVAPSPASPPEAASDGRPGGYVYLLRSEQGSEYYTGSTIDLGRRMQQHNDGMVSSTRPYQPWVLMGYEAYPTGELARMRERALKRNPRMLRFFRKRMLTQAALRAEGR